MGRHFTGLLAVGVPAAAVAAMAIATPADAATYLITSYTGGVLVDGRMQGGAVNGFAAIDATNTRIAVGGNVTATGFSYGRNSLAISSNVTMLGWVSGGGVVGMSTGAPLNRVVDVAAQQQQQVFSGGRDPITETTSPVTFGAGQHVVYDNDLRATGYLDVTDITNRTIVFQGYDVRSSNDGFNFGMMSGGFIYELDAAGRPVGFRPTADGVSVDVQGFTVGGGVTTQLTSVDFLFADPITDRQTPNYEKDALRFGGYTASWAQMFTGGNDDPVIVNEGEQLRSDGTGYFSRRQPVLRGPGLARGGVIGAGRQHWVTLSNGAGAVPEPATWGLMIAGFGMVGASLRGGRGSARVVSA